MESTDVATLMRTLTIAAWAIALYIGLRLMHRAVALTVVSLGVFLYVNGAPLGSDAMTCAQYLLEVDGAASCKDTQSVTEIMTIGARIGASLASVGIELGLMDAIETTK